MSIRAGTLDGLHRERLLLPLLVIETRVADLRREARRLNPGERWMLLGTRPPVTAPALVQELDAGRVRLGSQAPYRPWSRRRRRVGEVRFQAWEHLYSPYQIPLLRDALDVAASGPRRGWRREVHEHAVERVRSRALQSESWIAVLMALEPWYYPPLIQKTHLPGEYGGSFEAYDAADRAFMAADAFAALDWSAEDLRKRAEEFIWNAHTRDPLRNWVDLTSLIHPEKWDRLEGEARLALDLRQSAELILRFLEELGRDGVVPALGTPPRYAYSLLGDRLKPQRADLDRILSDFGISPHPAVILLGEGPTERFLFEQLMRMFGIPILDSFIRLETLGGVKKQLELLAKHLAPSLRAAGAGHLDMLRPPTRLLLAVDAEGRYATPAMRVEQKRVLAQHLFNALDEEFKNATTRSEMDHLVKIETWSIASDLEFSHFSDLALARAVTATGTVPPEKTQEILLAEIADLRRAGLPLKRLYEDWPTRLNKLQLWKFLWPGLRARVVRARRRGTHERIPAVRILFRAYELAARPRRHIILRTE
jgi:hypothetical protein